jgi:hypothetical protein
VAATTVRLAYGLIPILGILLDGCFKLDFTGLEVETAVNLADLPMSEANASISPSSSGIEMGKSATLVEETRGNGNFPGFTGSNEEDGAG